MFHCPTASAVGIAKRGESFDSANFLLAGRRVGPQKNKALRIYIREERPAPAIRGAVHGQASDYRAGVRGVRTRAYPMLTKVKLNQLLS